MTGEADHNPAPNESLTAERLAWIDSGVCVVKGALSTDDITAVTEILGRDSRPSRSHIMQKNQPLGFDRLHYVVDKGALVALPAWDRLRQSVLAITGTELELRWSGATQHYPPVPRPDELPHRDFAMLPKAVAATVCMEGGINVTVWPDALGDYPTGRAKSFSFESGDVCLLDLEAQLESPPYNAHYSWSRLHSFEVGPELETTSITVDFSKPQLAWTMDEEVSMSHLNW